MQFVFGNCGLGDMIAWTTAIQWTIENHPHIQGKVIVPPFFSPLAKNWFKKYEPRFAVRNELVPGLGFLQPTAVQPNANGFHMIEVGFIHYCNKRVPPGWFKYPEIRGDETDCGKFKLPEKYIVLTPGATAPNKELPAQTQNEIIDWSLEHGITPVFMGKRQVDIAYQAKFSNEIHYHKGIDLRDKTDVLQAACILANAWAVTGLDSGLTNLAACSKVPIVLGLTISNIQIPPRPERLFIIEPPEYLACRYCSNQIRFVEGDSTLRCYTGTFECTRSLTGAKYISALESIL